MAGHDKEGVKMGGVGGDGLWCFGSGDVELRVVVMKLEKGEGGGGVEGCDGGGDSVRRWNLVEWWLCLVIGSGFGGGGVGEDGVGGGF